MHSPVAPIPQHLPHPRGSSETVPLAVDLDGTLVRTDLLVECLSRRLRQPSRWLETLAGIVGPRAALKERLAAEIAIDPAALPYHEALVEWLRQERATGRHLVLATAAHEIHARRIAEHLGLFDTILATRGETNLKGSRKAAALVERFGNGGFDYVGNDHADLPIWDVAREAHVAGPGTGMVRRLRGAGKPGKEFPWEGHRPGAALIRALRPHQWMKNLLVLAPIAGAHRLGDPTMLATAGAAFFCFGLVASSVYLLNDIADVEDDRRHPRKRHRPFASGDVPLATGWWLWPLCAAAGLGLAALLLPPAFATALTAYFLLTLAYSFHLKRAPILDVVTLAVLYTLRIVAGAFAVAVPLSFWLITISVFLFTSLAYVKRVSELRARSVEGEDTVLGGRGYSASDLPLVTALGVASGTLAVLVLALYIHDPVTATLYRTPKLLWLACPLLMHWISRVWLLAHRGQMDDDPVLFALRDRSSWMAGAVAAGVFLCARFLELSDWAR